jgi:hypothetical protein
MSSPVLPAVSRFEADLLTLLQGLLGHAPRSQWLPILTKAQLRPKCLSAAAVRLVEDTLAKGATRMVAEAGWRRERFLRGGEAAAGRLWERTTPSELGLVFSPLAIDFLMWATSETCAKPAALWKVPRKRQLALGDRWLLAAAYGAVRQSDIGVAWAQGEPWRNEPLCQLLYAADFEHPAQVPPLDFSPWLVPAGIAVLEASQRRLAELWIEMERAKERVREFQELRAMATSQRRALDAYLSAIDSIGRRDLARFLLVAARGLTAPGANVRSRVPELKLDKLRLADRQVAYRDAVVALQYVVQLGRWQAAARGIGYFDEGYAAAQLWKSDWETHHGDVLSTAATAALAETQGLTAEIPRTVEAADPSPSESG